MDVHLGAYVRNGRTLPGAPCPAACDSCKPVDMARDGAIYVCQSCGAVHGKWSGQCGACGQWNSIVEESRAAPPGAMKPATSAAARGRGVQFEGLQSETPE